MGKHRIQNVEELWLLPVPEFAGKVLCLGFAAYWSVLVLSFASASTCASQGQ